MSSIPDRETVNTENRGLLMNSLCEWEYLQAHNKSGPITVNSTGVWLWSSAYSFDEIFSEIKGNQLGIFVIWEILLK